jgi:hypothetical protein
MCRIIDWDQREKQIAELDRRETIVRSFVAFSAITPVGDLDKLDQYEPLDGLRGVIRGRPNWRKMRHVGWRDVKEEEIFENAGIRPVGIQIYSGMVAGTMKHYEAHEGILVVANALNMERQEGGQIVRKYQKGPLSWAEFVDPGTTMMFGFSEYMGRKLAILRVARGAQRDYIEPFELYSGEHRVAKPCDQLEPTACVIFKYPDGILPPITRE